MELQQIMHEMPKGLLCWYQFKKHASALYIGEATDSIVELLRQLDLQVSVIEWQGLGNVLATSLKGIVAQSNVQKWNGDGGLEYTGYDYIVMPYAIEACKNPAGLLQQCYALLKEDGALLFGMNNRLGLRYFCGDRDPYTERNFDGIENYIQVLPKEREALAGREYSKAQVEEFMREAGWEQKQFYAVLPNLQAPQLIYGEGEVPGEDLVSRYFPRYHCPDTVFLNEERMYEDLIANDMFHQMANAYLVECVKREAAHSKARQVTLSLERSPEDALATIIYQDKVEKRPVYPAGVRKFEQMSGNEADLRAHGIATVEAEMVDGVYTMPYVDAPIGTWYLQDLFFKDTELFLKALDEYRDLVMNSSEHVESEAFPDEVVLRRGYIDLVSLNSFYVDGKFVFYDQEFVMENLPANVLLYRTIVLVYSKGLEMQEILPIESLWKRYGMEGKLEVYARYSGEFTSKLRNIREQRVYLEQHEKNWNLVNSNRQRMNFSAQEYQRLFVDIFEGLENKKLILFGSGNFTKKFLALYAKDYPVHWIVDNASEKWGTEMEGVPIVSPEALRDMEDGTYKVIICIKKYLDVLKQLRQMGVKHLGIYDVNINYPRKEKPVLVMADSNTPPKKYHKGYIAGVFDLYHIGHLNMFRRAKEQCDYLIVGVVTDEGVRKNKKVEPFIPFEERIEMVRSCKYVDEAVEIPLEYCGTKDAHRMYHFDCQFSGSDYVNDPAWLSEKAYLEKQGVEMVFFPYTEATSSTKIKALIEKSLL